ncbi:hypothetical protein [Algibacter sp.]
MVKLILGSTFEFLDLVAYTLGIMTVVLFEYKYLKTNNKKYVFSLKK